MNWPQQKQIRLKKWELKKNLSKEVLRRTDVESTMF